MPIKQNYQLMATYNQWINGNIYKAASQLNPDALIKDRGAFFGSIFGTLNHIMEADTIWLKRFADHEANFKSLDYIRTLDNSLPSDFASLKPRREKYDDIIIAFSDELNEQAIESNLFYRDSRGESFTINFGHLLLHFFNHQIHHRGQVSTLFSQMDIDIGETDIQL